MQNIPRVIRWSKWQLSFDDDKPEYIPEEEVSSFDNDYEEEEFEEHDESKPVIVTPLGILPLKPFNDPSKVFNFWLFETSFTIDKTVARIINRTPGVEILDIFTRYRGRIAIGRLFPFQHVRQDIERQLDAVPPVKQNSNNLELPNEVLSQVKELQFRLQNQFPFWSIYVLPNGKIDIAASPEESEEFKNKVLMYKTSKEMVGGAIFESGKEIL